VLAHHAAQSANLLAAYERDEWPAWAQPQPEATIPPCPTCGATASVNRAGRNTSGTQRYRCAVCQRNFTVQPRQVGYDELLREQARALQQQGMGVRAIARQLGVNHQSVANWLAPKSR